MPRKCRSCNRIITTNRRYCNRHSGTQPKPTEPVNISTLDTGWIAIGTIHPDKLDLPSFEKFDTEDDE